MTPARALLSWFVLLAVAFANGAVRVTAYPPTLSDFAARQVAAGIGAVALGIAIWFLLRRWPIADRAHAWATGALWAALTVAFEAAMTRGGGRPWSEVTGQYALWRGSLWPLLVLWRGDCGRARPPIGRFHVEGLNVVPRAFPTRCARPSRRWASGAVAAAAPGGSSGWGPPRPRRAGPLRSRSRRATGRASPRGPRAAGGRAMPMYEFYCRRCKKAFAAEMHVSEHDRDVPECPSCHGKDEVEKRLSTFSPMTSHKSATY